ncbi:MAG TPA: universal stress protein [Pseudorhodoferax sp.]|nr:universal stress protein [Pseudorhodoferax sp.]
MYTTALLAYSGSRSGQEAARQGADFAAACGARVYLLAVVETNVGFMLAEAAAPSELFMDYQAGVRRVLDEGAEQLRRSGLQVEAHLRSGDPAQEIGLLAKELGADLVVVGHREQSTLARW